MVERRGRLARWVLVGSLLLAMAAAWAAVAGWYRARSRRSELDEARRALAEGRLAWARERLIRLADRWDGDGDVLLLLGQCELERGRRDGSFDPSAREAALAAWRGCRPPATPIPARQCSAPLNRSTRANMRRPRRSWTTPCRRSGRTRESDTTWSGARSLLYRREGRMDDVRRVLRASWCRSPGRSPDPSSVLKELWLLDHSPMPVEAWEQRALDQADPEDDRVWLGRANLAILTGRFAEAAGWLDRALARRPRDPAVWRAKLALARGVGDVSGVSEAAAHLPAESLGPGALSSLRAWMAGRLGRADDERRELAALIAEEPGNAPALERMAVLAVEAGQSREAEGFRRRKAEIDRTQDRLRKLLLDANPSPHAEELARLCRTKGRDFDARAWSLVAEALAAAPVAGSAPVHVPAFSPSLSDGAVGLSAPFQERAASGLRPIGPTLADRLADLRPSGGAFDRSCRVPSRCRTGPSGASLRRGGRGRRPPLHLRQRPDRASPPARDDVGRGGPARLRRRRMARRVLRPGRGAVRGPGGLSALDARRPPLPQPRRRDLRGRHRGARGSPRSPGGEAMGWASRWATTTTMAIPTCS